MDSAQCSDTELVERSRRGDEVAFAALVTRHKPVVFSFLRYALPSREDAEDVTQETFVRAYLSLARFRGESTFVTWLLGIARHCIQSYWRARCVTESVDDTPPKEAESLPDVELCLDVRRAVAALPPMPDTTGALYLSADAIRQTVERFSRNVKMDEGHSPTRLPFLYRFRGEEP